MPLTPRRAAAPLLLALALAVPARRAAAQPDCAPASLADYVALGPTGCRLAGVVVHEFVPRPDRDALDPSLVRLAPRADAGPGGGMWLGFLVSGPFGPLTLTDDPGPRNAGARFGFGMEGTTVSGIRASVLGPAIRSTGDLWGSVSAGGFLYGSATRPTSLDFVTSSVVPAGPVMDLVANACLGALARADGSTSIPRGACTTAPGPLLFADVPTAGRVFELAAYMSLGGIGRDGTAVGSAFADADGFVAQYLVPAGLTTPRPPDGVVTSAPEPATLALAAPGLLLLGAAARRRRPAA